MKFLLYPFLLLPFMSLFVISCGNPTPPPKDTIEVQKAADEENLLFSLASELVANPRTQAEKDKNAIINYAMDQGIALQATQSGLYYQMIAEGQGQPAEWGDWVTVNYKGYTLDGQVFDSSYKKGKPMEFYVGNMIPGWNEGLQLMKKGGKAFFVVPSRLAYGEKGHPAGVAPNTVLAFEVELLDIMQK